VKKIYVTKHDGSRQLYDQQKAVNSILRAGVKKEQVTKILGQVESQLYDGISTSKLYHLVAVEVDKAIAPGQPHFYRLRENLGRIGSIDFEKFIKKVLENQGFECQWNQVIAGFCVEHQIDVIAKNKDHSLYFVEVKHHRNFHRQSGLGTVTELWARLEDLKRGFSAGRNKYNFSAAWLITNTKFSGHAKRYAKCKEMKLTGWRYTLNGEKTEGLEKMVEKLDPKGIRGLIG